VISSREHAFDESLASELGPRNQRVTLRARFRGRASCRVPAFQKKFRARPMSHSHLGEFFVFTLSQPTHSETDARPFDT
jgi:hypothetical protein